MINTDVTIRGGGYVAQFRSDLGGNCYRLYHEATGAELLRTPDDEKHLMSEIFLFGNPILFPPNRITGASFTFEGREYKFPLNEPATNCHIHGALYKTRFDIAEVKENSAVFTYCADAGEYIGFPHSFELTRRYSLSENGLSECVEVFNKSERNMPFMLAFHTTMNVPFAPVGDGEECYFSAPVVCEQLRSAKYIPILEYASGRPRDKQIADGSYRIKEGPLSAFYDCLGNETRITDKKSGLSLVCTASDEYKYRMLWRSDGAGFFVAEPQTCAIDCFHLEAPAEEKGLIVIAPAERIKLYTGFRIEKAK